MSESYPMTQAGYESLKSELKQLTSKDRPAVINAISTAREHGDLKENAEYHAAKEQQGFIEGRIQELNEKLALANVIDITKLSGEKVVFGATVSFVDVDTEKESSYQIVGADESDLQKNKISISSPIARALIGKSAGDTLSIPIPKGKIEIEILCVKFVN
ncbi:MAG: transcription elongation factor GreA [SAR324 cluster bacterium]|nr:transcription elongation factor GreA [SAR324 cluster bacterium]MEC9069039.1 transcription elongation factor GreA [SAR324 cluster bacterium]MED5515825.1 transcription elongation factor GreA [SAR324 cluster bacterium]